jgi:hypothetical protein
MTKILIIGVVFTVTIALSLTGCATTAGYEKILNSWSGGDINNLIASWGPPSSTFDMPNGNKIYTWTRVGNSVGYATYNPYTNSSTAYAGTYWCKTSFGTSNGTIINWHWEGNACRAP